MPDPAPEIISSQRLLAGRTSYASGAKCWRPRGTSDWLLTMTTSGSGRFGHALGVEFIADPGTLVLLRPGTRHDYGTADADHWEILWAHFYPRTSWSKLLRWPEVASGLHFLQPREETRERIKARFQDAHLYATGTETLGQDFAMNALEEILLICATIAPKEVIGDTNQTVHEAVEFVTTHYREKLTVKDVANSVGLSSSRINQIFRQHFGTSTMKYLEDYRISVAIQLLIRTSMSIGSISTATGFDTSFYFSIRFKQHVGMSPSEFRKIRSSLPMESER
jgi:AraC family transcriptional regulator, arabinose operon regulatory protein